ncbi:hypothetical protein A1F97_00651 [Pyrenophora tritici-repentis]|uniref:Uncharacterized protein n=1 Tax=Pyrenophora tritici-repentis TaxID=45151 RepID=A0A2W1HBJ2_9PLEO|nr:hypothetical protein Ptr86124_012268 [Pyrenophora tritici-repentis]KAI1667647.1 hypothetical protein L13192_08356 [Pyrenophora tritici-repentis]KAI1679858.1 hypothetical protein KJE20_10498 [Pyrenophora tritici-repentis]PZD46480.1 hypothetical protein A1F97_00651 [Pyrenophora tritici-repentis]
MVVNYSRTFARSPPSPAPSNSPTSLKEQSRPELWKRVFSASKTPTFQYLKTNQSTDPFSTEGPPTPPRSPKERQYTPQSRATTATPSSPSSTENGRLSTRKEWMNMPLERRKAALERVNELRVELYIPEKNLDGSMRPMRKDEGNYNFILDYADSRSPLY